MQTRGQCHDGHGVGLAVAREAVAGLALALALPKPQQAMLNNATLRQHGG